MWDARRVMRDEREQLWLVYDGRCMVKLMADDDGNDDDDEDGGRCLMLLMTMMLMKWQRCC